jgi:hypothetical protein
MLKSKPEPKPDLEHHSTFKYMKDFFEDIKFVFSNEWDSFLDWLENPHQYSSRDMENMKKDSEAWWKNMKDEYLEQQQAKEEMRMNEEEDRRRRKENKPKDYRIPGFFNRLKWPAFNLQYDELHVEMMTHTEEQNSHRDLEGDDHDSLQN